MRTEPNTQLFEKWDFEKYNINQDYIKELHFIYIPKGNILKLPYLRRLEFQKFLNSWDLQETPEWQKLIW